MTTAAPATATKLILCRPPQDDPGDEPVSLRFERRSSVRRPVSGRMMVRAWVAGSGVCAGVVPLELVDDSGGGIGGVCRAPMEVGTVCEVYRASGVLPAIVGEVVRCEPRGGGAWRIGLRRSCSRAA